MLDELLKELRKPFHPSQITWKPGAVKGERALALAYADLRAYMNRLDEVCGSDWGVTYEPWGENRVICCLTISGVTRSSTGESTNEAERGEIGGTVAEAQSFKRAAAMFGLGRYLYALPSGWADYDPKTKKFTDKAKAKLTSILIQHYRRANEPESENVEIYTAHDTSEETEGAPSTDDEKDAYLAGLLEQFDALGSELYADQWPQVSARNVERISKGGIKAPSNLTPELLEKLINGMMTLKSRRQPSA
jgi:hypothetical protein